MKFFNSIGPNPRAVRMFMLEKELSIPFQEVDILAAENRKPEFVEKNPAGQLPLLEMENGECLAEVVAICEYLDELEGGNGKRLMGETAEERALTRMWTRRIDLNVIQPITLGFRYGEGADFFAGKEPIFKDSSANMKELAQIKLEWLNGLLGDNEFICGNRFTLVDILLYSFLDFAAGVGQPLNPSFANIAALMARVAERPSAQGSA